MFMVFEVPFMVPARVACAKQASKVLAKFSVQRITPFWVFALEMNWASAPRLKVAKLLASSRS